MRLAILSLLVLVLVFTANHCPTAQAYEDRIAKLDADYASRGVQVVLVSPNDPLALRLDEQGYTDLDDTHPIQDAINIHGFDELIISTLPQRVSKWLKLDLPSKAAGLGLPVTTVIASSREERALA